MQARRVMINLLHDLCHLNRYSYTYIFTTFYQEPVRVFENLAEARLQELVLIREISNVLQNKKEEDMANAAVRSHHSFIYQDRIFFHNNIIIL